MCPDPGVESRAAIAAAPQFAPEHLGEILTSLVRTPSVNPGGSETAMVERIGRWLRDEAGLELETVELAPGRPSAAAVLRGERPGPRLVLNGHTDTVPVEDAELWSTDPFGGEVIAGSVYGRGACDMKAGLAVEIAVAAFLSRHLASLSGELVLHFAAGEESAEPGTASLLDAGFGGDFGITLEPTELRVATAARGRAVLQVDIRGSSRHASVGPGAGNPIEALPAVLGVVGRHAASLRASTHPLLGAGTVTPTRVHAGVKDNMVPGGCQVVLDRRFLPGDDVSREAAGLAAAMREELDPALSVDVSVGLGYFEAAEARLPAGVEGALGSACERVLGRPLERWGTPFASDVRDLVNRGGMPAVTFGPGSIANCHCVDEHVALVDVRDAALFVAAVAGDLLLDDA